MDEHKLQEVLQTLARIDTKLDTALAQICDHEERLRALEGRKWQAVGSSDWADTVTARGGRHRPAARKTLVTTQRRSLPLLPDS